MSDDGPAEDDCEPEELDLDKVIPVESTLRSAQGQWMPNVDEDAGSTQKGCSGGGTGLAGDDDLDELCAPVSDLRSVQDRDAGEDCREGEDG